MTPVINNASSISNIYNSDGSLTNDRVVKMNGKNLIFNPSNVNSNFFINGITGRVAIGSTTPLGNLDVKGGLSDGVTFSTTEEMYNQSMVLNLGSYVDSMNQRRNLTFFDLPQSNFKAQSEVHLAIEDRNDANRFRFIGTTNGGTWFALSDKTQSQIFTVNENNGNVKVYLPKQDSYLGIGTSNFIDGTDIYRLAVKGAIRADRVKVYTNWADFVFEKDYSLPTLEEVERHIKENGHLKDIPSAIEVEKNGIELGDMNKRLLQKVEELTLYLIELNKELKEVKEKLNQKSLMSDKN